MNRICWWFQHALTRLLPAGERDAVCGDIEEAGESGAAALRDVIGLIARREAEWWRADCQRWLPMIVVADLLAIRLSLYARDFGRQSAVYAWMYLNNWTPLYVDGAAWRWDLIQYVAVFVLAGLRIACFSAGAGAAIGFISRRAWALNALVLYLLVIACAVAILVQQHDDAPFALALYNLLLPLTAEAALVAGPAFWGMRLGRRFERRSI